MCEYKFSNSFHHRCSSSHQNSFNIVFSFNISTDIIVTEIITTSFNIMASTVANLPIWSLLVVSSTCNLLRVAAESSHVPSKSILDQENKVREFWHASLQASFSSVTNCGRFTKAVAMTMPPSHSSSLYRHFLRHSWAVL